MSKNNEIGISIEKINEISFYAKPLPMPIEEIHLGVNLLFGLGFSFDINLKSEKVIFNTVVKYQIKDIEEPVLQLENEIIFHIQNLKEVIKIKKDNEMDVENNFLITLTGVAIGTLRGMLAANTKSTQWANFPLPLLNPQQVIQEMNPNK